MVANGSCHQTHHQHLLVAENGSLLRNFYLGPTPLSAQLKIYSYVRAFSERSLFGQTHYARKGNLR